MDIYGQKRFITVPYVKLWPSMTNYSQMCPLLPVPFNFRKIPQVLPYVAYYAKNGQMCYNMTYNGLL